MKKFLYFVVVLLSSVLLLTACGQNASNRKTITVAFDSTGGSPVEALSVAEGDVVRNPGAPTREGYVFNGWFISAEADAQKWSFATEAVVKDTTLYAHWTEKTNDDERKTEDKEEASQEGQKPDGKKILIVYFSRADENYNVGTIEKGNTEIVAEMIAEREGGDTFKIERTTAYPAEYTACTNEAKTEQRQNARPALRADVEVEEYDLVFLGYPIWWGDLPMPVYTFIENHDWTGKTVMPFCTHEGSGLSGTVSALRSALSVATVKEGLAIRGATAQNSRTETRNAVDVWLNELELD